MDSTNPQAPQQQQPPPPLPTQQQPPPTPQPTQQPQQHQRPQPQTQTQHQTGHPPPQVSPYSNLAQFQPSRPPYMPPIHFQQPHTYYYPPPPHPPPNAFMQSAPPTTWVPDPATYTAQQAQPTMVTSQPQSNVPQHNKSSHVIGGPLISERRPQNSNLQTVTVPNSQASTITATNTKKRSPAILKDPKTGKVVPLSDDNNASATKNSTPVTKPSQNAEHVTTLLQKVSEENKEENKENAVNIKTEKTNSTQKEHRTKQPKQQTPPPVQQQKKQQQQSPQLEPQKQPEPEQQQPSQSPQKEQHNEAPKKDVAKVDNNDKQKPAEMKQNNNVSPKDEKVKPIEPNQNIDEDRKENAVVEDVSDDGQTDKQTASNPEEEAQKETVEEESDPLASLTYETWQYNPVSNRQGKKIYSKQFLLDVCEKIVKIDPLQKENEEQTGFESNRHAFNDKFDMFAPNFSSNSQRFNTNNRQNDPSRRQSQQNYAGRSSAGQEKPRKVITSVSLTQEVELKTTNNPWRPTKENKDLPTDEVETESLKKKFRSILNKLTPNNFDNLAHSVTQLNIDTESKLGEVIDIVFAKALAEPGYCVLYGQMCSHLKKISAGTANFGNTLLKRCQHQFQSDIYAGINMKERKEKVEAEQNPEVKKQLEEELYEDMYRCRMRGLGLIKFIGELYKIEMLNDKIMIDCVVRLLLDTSEESLECLCDLLATIGEKLDRSTSQKNNEKEKKATKAAPKVSAYGAGQKSAAAVLASGISQQQPKSAEHVWNLDTIFEELHKIRKNKELDLPVRIRFKLLDTCELRERDNWLSKKTKDNNPKKIDEIREAHKEKLEQERKQNAMGPRRSQEGRRLGHSGCSSNQLSAMDSGGGYRNNSLHTSSSSHLIRDHSMSDSMKSNHDDIESQKEHQKHVENLKEFFLSKKSSSTNISVSLKPNSRVYHNNANKQS